MPGVSLGVDARPWGTRAALTCDGEIVEVFAVRDHGCDRDGQSTAMVWRRVAAAVDEAQRRSGDPLTAVRIACLPTTNSVYEVARLKRELPDADIEVVVVSDSLARRSRGGYLATDGRPLDDDEVSALAACGAALNSGRESSFLVPDVATLAAVAGTQVDRVDPASGPQSTEVSAAAPYQAVGRSRGLAAVALASFGVVAGLSGLLGTDTVESQSDGPEPTTVVATTLAPVEPLPVTVPAAPTTITPPTTVAPATTGAAAPVISEVPFELNFSGFDFNQSEDDAGPTVTEGDPQPSAGGLTDIFAGLEVEADPPSANLTDIFANIDVDGEN